jgi:hypothetical protein
MNAWRLVFTILIGLAAAGCRSDPSRELLERDNCDKDLEINRLKNQVQDLEEALNANRPAGARILPGGEFQPEPAVTRPGGGPLLAPPGKSEPDVIPHGEPSITPGIESPQGEVPDRLKVPGDHSPARPSIPPVTPTAGEYSTGVAPPWNTAGQPAREVAAGPGAAIAQITLHPALTGGIGTNGRTADEGLLVVVEPRDFAGNIIAQPADLKVALVDPALSGEKSRLARWDFSAAQTQGMVHTGAQPGIHVRLPWKSMPAHDRLKVYVRYTTPDGRKLQAERLIGVALNDSPPPDREVPERAAPPSTATRPEWSPVR